MVIFFCLVQLEVCEISKNKELTRVDDVPEVVEVLFHTNLSHLAYFYHKIESERYQTYHVAHLCYPMNLYDSLDHYRENKRHHVEQE